MDDWKARRAANGERLMAILKGCAVNSQLCPTTGALVRTMQLTANMVESLFDNLRDAGRIESKIIYCGKSVGRRRWVHLIDECMWTGKPISQARAYLKAPVDDSALARAKTALQKRGCFVWDAAVTGGPRGLVKVDHELLTPVEVIARAQVTL